MESSTSNSAPHGVAVTGSGKTLGPARCSLQVAQDRVRPIVEIVHQWERHLMASEEKVFASVLPEVARRTSLPAVQLYALAEMERQVFWNGCVGILGNECFGIPKFAAPAYSFLGYDRLAELTRKLADEIDLMMIILDSDEPLEPPEDFLDSVLREIDDAFSSLSADVYHKDGPAWIQSNPEVFDIKSPHPPMPR